MNCTRCEGTGFLNTEQIPGHIFKGGTDEILRWIKNEGRDSDVAVCDCCGDGENWHGDPGQHYGTDDPVGKNGPYAYNGGLAECH